MEKQRWEESEKRREEKKREDQRRERVRRKKIQAREKVEKSQITMFFQWFVAPEGRKEGSLKRRVWSQLARWEMETCTPLCREAYFQLKMYNTPRARSTFQVKMHKHLMLAALWSRKSAGCCGTKHISKSKCVQETPFLEHFWKLTCRKSARHVGAKHISEMHKSPHVWTTFGRSDCALVKSKQNVRVLKQFQQGWQVWDIWRGSAKMHFPWQAQYKRHVHQRC